MADDDAGGYYEEKPLMFFGRDVSKIPCFRNSFLYGLTSGLFGGLGYFMFTSKIPQSYRFGATTYLAVTIGYWLQCRYVWLPSVTLMLGLVNLEDLDVKGDSGRLVCQMCFIPSGA
ncbi:cytochrome c oxidase assembly protein COX20, mitochondrial-like [Nilaparvata lugens]|uniref:cytochrome c oxidase assembly protein COX20, mitochondrial-like n=1 Tax=Nilaparvata lugens TaxID=108931 RepID=UPI00193D911E|nr:cytochrome c oxidase assembly protein COX20, mitochondrial-like [Nilaparvata lugens]